MCCTSGEFRTDWIFLPVVHVLSNKRFISVLSVWVSIQPYGLYHPLVSIVGNNKHFEYCYRKWTLHQQYIHTSVGIYAPFLVSTPWISWPVTVRVSCRISFEILHFDHINIATLLLTKNIHLLYSYRKSTTYQRNVCARTHLLIVLQWNLPLSGHHACMPLINTCTGLTVVIWISWIVLCMHTHIW